MSNTPPPAAVAVLDRALGYTCGALQRARSSPLTLPTPCAEWDLGRLLAHMEDSMAALAEAAETGYVGLGDELADNLDPPAAGAVVDRVVQQAHAARAAWLERLTSAPVTVGDPPHGLVLGRDTLVLVGAVEVAVHGWDVAVATGRPTPIPDALAARLRDVALAVVTAGDRGRRFGPPVDVPAGAAVGDRLLGWLGRG